MKLQSEENSLHCYEAVLHFTVASTVQFMLTGSMLRMTRTIKMLLMHLLLQTYMHYIQTLSITYLMPQAN